MNWASAVGQNLRGVDPAWIREIERLQPFDPGDAGQRPGIHPLAILDHVNNLNKHRFLPAALLSVEQLGLLINVESVRGEVIESQDFLDRPITPDGELARFRVPSRVHLEVAVNQAPHCRLSFDDGLDYDWHPIELVEWVRETVVQFEPAFRR